MSNVEHLKKTKKNNWQSFKLLNENGVFQCRLTELQEKLGLPMNCCDSIPNLNEVEDVARDVFDEFENSLLPIRAIDLLKILNRKERYFPEIDDGLLAHAYFRMREFVEKKDNVSSAVSDPFWRWVLRAVDLSSPDAPAILLDCGRLYLSGCQNTHSSSPLLEIQELTSQEITLSHLALFLSVEWYRFILNNIFFRDLRKIREEFSLGKEWSPFIAMYALTGQIFEVLVPPANVYIESLEGRVKIEIGPRTPQRDISLMWPLINKRLGSKKRNYPLRNLPRDLKIRELSQKKKEEAAKINARGIWPVGIGPTNDEGIAVKLDIIKDKWAGPEETKRAINIVKQQRKRIKKRIDN